MATTQIIATATQFLTASAAAYYTVTSGSVIGNLKEVVACNISTTTDYNFTMHFVPSAGSASDGNMVINVGTVSAHTMVRIPFNTFLAAGTSIQAFANSASKITFTVSAVEYS